MTYSTIPIYNNSSSSDETLKTEHKSTAYEKIRMIYSRNTEEFLNKREFSYSMPKDLFSKLTGSIDGGVLCIGENILAWEFKREDIWAGIIIEDFDKESKFESWFFHLLLSTSSVNYNMASEESFEKYTDKIANKFVEELKNTTLGDQWDATGEEHFKGVVNFFTSRGAPIEAVLPAFPCKSSNMMKVASQLPDLGEALSLKRLVSFAESIKKVYPPGMKIWIVSDGHVFSDCIAVDDDVVDKYFKALKQIYESLNAESDPIRFCSLVDIFSLKKSDFDDSIVEDVQIVHYLNTKVNKEAEACRKVLLASCDTDCGNLNRDIKTLNHPRLFLFRGFSRFMTEDLKNHPIINQVSRKKFKKIVSKVAFEMIKRNDAYSNLVELIFPYHLRFSIHAHTNSGPKYGIQLLTASDCFVINSLEDHCSPSLSDLLHIPTPWHNSIVVIGKQKFVIKSEEVYNGYKNGGEGSWNEDSLCFEFKKLV